HLPRLAQRSGRFALLRSLTHYTNDHSTGTALMLTGRNAVLPGFDGNRPTTSDWPSLAAAANSVLPTNTGVPTSAILPHLLIHRTGRTLPGQQGGLMGGRHDAWLVDAAAKCTGYGSCPHCFYHDAKTQFSHGDGPL